MRQSGRVVGVGRGELTDKAWAVIEPLLPDKILEAAIVKDDAVGDVEWIVSIDSTVMPAHQHAAEAPQKGDPHEVRSTPSTWTGNASAGPGEG